MWLTMFVPTGMSVILLGVQRSGMASMLGVGVVPMGTALRGGPPIFAKEGHEPQPEHIELSHTGCDETN